MAKIILTKNRLKLFLPLPPLRQSVNSHKKYMKVINIYSMYMHSLFSFHVLPFTTIYPHKIQM